MGLVWKWGNVEWDAVGGAVGAGQWNVCARVRLWAFVPLARRGQRRNHSTTIFFKHRWPARAQHMDNVRWVGQGALGWDVVIGVVALGWGGCMRWGGFLCPSLA